MTTTDTRPTVPTATLADAPGQPPEIPLPEAALAALLGLAEEKEKCWSGTAEIVAALIADYETRRHHRASGTGKMRLYADVAAAQRQHASTVRGWHSVYKRIGGDVIDEFPALAYSHWRLIVSQMRATERSAPDLAAEWLATSDDHGGLVVPPDVMAARLADAGREPRATKWDRALERLQRALVSALRVCPAGSTDALARVSAALAELEGTA